MYLFFTRARLEEALRTVGVMAESNVFETIATAYDSPHRHYHNRQHIDSCLLLLEQHADHALRPAEIAVAIWFHDIVYDSRRRDNEERSATAAENFLNQHHAPADAVKRITSMIRATQDHQSDDRDTKLLIDIDLSILGSSPDEFDAYDSAIRREYSWIPDRAYRSGRHRVLESFAARQWIFQTEPFRLQFEQQSRKNLGRKLRQLENEKN